MWSIVNPNDNDLISDFMCLRTTLFITLLMVWVILRVYLRVILIVLIGSLLWACKQLQWLQVVKWKFHISSS